MGVERLRSLIDPAIARRHAHGRPAPALQHGSHRRGVADPGPPPAARNVWRSAPQVPATRGAQRPPLDPARGRCLAFHAARSAALADGVADLARLAPGWPLAQAARSAPRRGPHPHGAPSPARRGHHRCPDGEGHGNRGAQGDDGAKQLNGRKRHCRGATAGLLLRVLVHPADLRDADMAPWWFAAAYAAFERLPHLWAAMA
jgi:hypothetical protein